MKSALDTQLAQAEDGEVAAILRGAARQTALDPDFADDLEGRLRRMSPAAASGPRVAVRRWLPAGVAVCALAGGLLYSSRHVPTVSAAQLISNAVAATTFVPTGQVRHVVMTMAASGAGSSTLERWYANGTSHIMMRQQGAGGALLIVGNATIWNFVPQQHRVWEQPIAYASQVTDWLPSSLAQLQQADAHLRLAGETTILGRRADEIDATYGAGQTKVRLWIDAQTYEQLRVDTLDGGGRLVSSLTVTEDQLEPASSLPAGFFSFSAPAGVQVVNEAAAPPVG